MKEFNRIRVTCVSDLHGYLPDTLPSGDLLIVAGDLTKQDSEEEYFRVFDWIHEQPFKKKILVGGNHDNLLEKESYRGPVQNEFDYLCDSGTEFEGFKIWGSPCTKKFFGQNPRAMAFSVDSEQDLAAHWAKIPVDTDILITHCPPFGILDRNYVGQHCGSVTLYAVTSDDCLPNLKLHVFGHMHEEGGRMNVVNRLTWVNASYVDEFYKPVNQPRRVSVWQNLQP